MAVRSAGLRRHEQRGVALITVLMVFFFATTIATSMIARQRLDIRRTINLADHGQALHYAGGAEAAALRLLLEDREESPEVDHAGEDWADENLSIRAEYGSIEFQMVDLQGRFNLNNLAAEAAEKELQRFQRLLAVLDLPTGIAESVKDWVDADSDQSGFDGAEDNEYLVKEPPYRAANRPMSEISELRLVHGVTDEHAAILAPHVATLPVGTPINVNSADEMVLRSLAEDLGELEAEQILLSRKGTPFETVDKDFAKRTLVPESIDKEGLSVNSEFFTVQITAKFGDRVSRLESFVHRPKEGDLKVMGRDLSRRFGETVLRKGRPRG